MFRRVLISPVFIYSPYVAVTQQVTTVRSTQIECAVRHQPRYSQTQRWVWNPLAQPRGFSGYTKPGSSHFLVNRNTSVRLALKGRVLFLGGSMIGSSGEAVRLRVSKIKPTHPPGRECLNPQTTAYPMGSRGLNSVWSKDFEAQGDPCLREVLPARLFFGN